MSLVATYTYEEGTDGAAIASGSNGVVAVGGSPVYAAAAAIHGSMGSSLVGSGSAVLYNVGNANGQESVYCKLHVAGSAPTSLNLKNGSTFCGRVRFNQANGRFDISDGSGTLQTTSSSSYTVDQTVRLDIRHTYSGTTLTVTVAIFLGANSEGTTPDETMGPVSFTSSLTPTRFGGQSVSGSTLYVDTVRIYDDATTWPSPYNAASPATGSATLTLSATGTAGVPGATGGATLALSASAGATAPGTGAATLTLAATGTATPHVPVTPQLDVSFDDGTTGGFGVVQGATVGSSYAHDGANGCRLAPAAGTSYATLTYSGLDGDGYTWAVFRGWFRVVTKTSDSNTFTDLIEIGNELTVAPKGQFTVYTNSGDLGVDFNTSDFSVIDPAYATGVWHFLEARVFFGDTTFVAHVRYDGVEYLHTSSNEQTATALKVLWIQYPSTVTDQTVDWDGIKFWGGNFDPGYLDDAPTAAGSASLTLTAAGAASLPATGSATLALSGSGTGRAAAAGSASITLTATGAAAVTGDGSYGSGSYGTGVYGGPLVGDGSYGSGSYGAGAYGGAGASATGAATLTLTASGVANTPASGTASLSLSAAATGAAAVAGVASLTLTASGAVVTGATGTAVISLSATGLGLQPGGGLGFLALTGSATAGTTTTGAADLALTATGTAPQPSSGAATLTLTATGTGSPLAAGAATLTLSASGTALATGAGGAVLTLTATGAGTSSAGTALVSLSAVGTALSVGARDVNFTTTIGLSRWATAIGART